MTVNMLKSKIHRATVKQAELQYVGSITIDEALMEAAGIFEYEKVQIVDIENGNRFETYVIAGERKIIIMCYADMTPEEVQTHKPKVVFVDEENKISRLTNYEKHGRLEDM